MARVIKVLIWSSILILHSSCSFYNEVEIGEVDSFSITSFGNDGMDFIISLPVKNPNFFDIKGEECDVQMFIGDNMVGEAVFKSPFIIQSNFNDTLNIEFTARFNQNIQRNMRDIMKMAFGHAIKMKVIGEVAGNAFFITKHIPIELEEEILLK